jgi:hypothetical protein
MKYIVFDEMSAEDIGKMTEKDLAVHVEERKKGSIPKHVVPDHILHGDLPQLTESFRFFKIYETDDPKQLENIDALWSAMDMKSWKRWIIPISEMDPTRKVPWPAYSQYKKRLGK